MSAPRALRGRVAIAALLLLLLPGASRAAAAAPPNAGELRFGVIAEEANEPDRMLRVYAELLAYQAGGGGDTPEHVGQGLHDALNAMQWSGGDNVLRLVFLVGDAPPHDDYQEGLTTAELAAQARAKGIVINTIQCGGMFETTAPWQRIADATGGQFSRIAQDGGVVAVATPFDARLQSLNNELAGTVMSWGSASDKQASQVKLGNRMHMSASSAAEAASYSARTSRMNDEDLLWALDNGKALAEIPAAELPAELQGMSEADRGEHVKEVRKKRDLINAQIREVAAQRDAFLRDAEAKAGVDAGFDGQVVETLRKQAASIGVAY